MQQPQPFDAGGPRYTRLPLPSYRHLPGVTPHPRRHPRGHQYGKPEAVPRVFQAAHWRHSLEYLFGVDLYNHAFYWEAHEAWEGIWKTTRRKDLTGAGLQGLIQVSAALLKREQRIWRGMIRLSRAGLTKLQRVAAAEPRFCGIDLPDYARRLESIFAARDLGEWPADPRIHLQLEY